MNFLVYRCLINLAAGKVGMEFVCTDCVYRLSSEGQLVSRVEKPQDYKRTKWVSTRDYVLMCSSLYYYVYIELHNNGSLFRARGAPCNRTYRDEPTSTHILSSSTVETCCWDMFSINCSELTLRIVRRKNCWERKELRVLPRLYKQPSTQTSHPTLDKYTLYAYWCSRIVCLARASVNLERA